EHCSMRRHASGSRPRCGIAVVSNDRAQRRPFWRMTMQRFDHRGLALSCGSQESIDGYEQALIALHSYSGDPLKLIDDTLANDPDFFTGHAFRAALFVTAGDRRGVAELERSVNAAEA